jgi:hypothetical protein
MKLPANEARQEMFSRLNQAQVHHDLLCALRDSLADNDNLLKFNRNLRFFNGVESALFNSTVVLLYSLYETRHDTINFYRLLESIEDRASPEQLADYRQRIDAIKPLWIQISILRNRMVGHQALDASALSVQSETSLSVGDVDKLLDCSKGLLLDISSAHYDTHVDFMEGSRPAVNTLLSRLAP